MLKPPLLQSTPAYAESVSLLKSKQSAYRREGAVGLSDRHDSQARRSSAYRSDNTACRDGAFGAFPRPRIALNTSTEQRTGFASAGVVTVLSSRAADLQTEEPRRYKRPTRLAKLVGRLLDGAGQFVAWSVFL